MKIDLEKLAKNVWFAETKEVLGWGEVIAEGRIYNLIPETLKKINEQKKEKEKFKFSVFETIMVRHLINRLDEVALKLAALAQSEAILSYTDEY